MANTRRRSVSLIDPLTNRPKTRLYLEVKNHQHEIKVDSGTLLNTKIGL